MFWFIFISLWRYGVLGGEKKKKGKSFSKEHVYKAMLSVFIPELENLIPESVYLISKQQQKTPEDPKLIVGMESKRSNWYGMEYSAASKGWRWDHRNRHGTRPDRKYRNAANLFWIFFGLWVVQAKFLCCDCHVTGSSVVPLCQVILLSGIWGWH